MITRYLARRVIGALMRLGRTLRGQERTRSPEVGTDMGGTALSPHKPTQEVES